LCLINRPPPIGILYNYEKDIVGIERKSWEEMEVAIQVMLMFYASYALIE
jgi:hypothetical protein